MKKLGLVLALGLAAVACGDDAKSNPDASTAIDGKVTDGAMPDGNNPNANLTTYVIDLVKNHTNNTDLPRAFTEFSTLPDPDQTSNNLAAYASLFM